MNIPAPPVSIQHHAARLSGWRELWLKEDWWAVWLGLGIVLVAYALFAHGHSLEWVAVSPAKWSGWSDLGNHFSENWPRYLAQFALWAVLFSIALRALGQQVGQFLPAFLLVYLFAVLIFTLGQWTEANRYNLEPPLVALVLGLVISNVIGLPAWLDAGFRVEFYVKTGIVLLGATLPFTLIVWAGPVALLQASIVSLVTFMVIFTVGRRLGLDRRFAAVLGAGGSVCGVSASIAIAGAVGARKQDASVAIATVIAWAIVMIFALPLAARLLHLSSGVAGAWIGTSEFADAAGLAAADTYGHLAGSVPGIAGTPEQALFAFTLMKVIGRDIWIGVWALVLSLIASTRWEHQGTDVKPDFAQIWWRFPKFVLGFLAASALVTMVAAHYGQSAYHDTVTPQLVTPLKDLRTWAFIFCFFSIGLTTRVRELARIGPRPFLAFSAGVAVNVILGFILSAWVFALHWQTLAH
jgi:uncharacterized integral membrane protein (TIGR00698 family)